jgi:probable phosphoglycerate mutase
MANVYLVRHGDAVGTEGKFHGMKDNPLTKQGVNEGMNIARTLRETGTHFKRLYSSPLSRTMDTASFISDELGLPVEPRKELLPLDLGAYVGRPIKDHEDEVRHYLLHPKEKIVNGESVDNWAHRYIPFANKDLFDGTDDNVIYVTHGRNILLTKADLKLGNNLKYDNNFLAENGTSTKHGGYAIANGDDKSFKIVTPKKTAAGIS